MLAALLALTSALLTAAPADPPARDLHELHFTLEATHTSTALGAFVRAQASLLLGAEDGGRRLALLTPLAPAWKLYAVDPAGPFGEEVKLAAEVVLPEPTWAAVDEARREVDALGSAEFERFRTATGSRLAFGGAFAFLVIGPSAGRVVLELDTDGRLVRAKESLTRPWLSGELDPLLTAWQRARAAGGAPPLGYWFWNRGETSPFSYEPHVYHSLLAALRLLGEPIGTVEQTGESVFRDRAREILRTLAPKIGAPRGGDRRRERLRFVRTINAESNAAHLLLEHADGRLEITLRLTRERTESRESRAQNAQKTPAALPPVASRELASTSRRTS